MKALFFIALIFLSLFTHGQDTLDKIMSADVCNCINKTKIITQKDFLDCLQTAMQKNSDLIIKECYAIYKDTSNETGYKFGRALFERISVSMIYSCNSYLTLMDSLRYGELKEINKDSVINSILEINKQDKTKWDKDFFTQRGVLYFKVSDLNNALNDFNAALELDQNALQSIYFKAWTLELLERYDEAFSLYSNLAVLTKKNEFNIFAAIAKQKKTNQ